MAMAILANIIFRKHFNTNLNLKLEKGVITILAPSFGFSSKAIAFGSIYKGTVADKDFALKNVGTDTLTVSLEKDELTKFALTDFDTKTTTITWPQKIYPGSELKINARFDSSKMEYLVKNYHLKQTTQILKLIKWKSLFFLQKLIMIIE